MANGTRRVVAAAVVAAVAVVAVIAAVRAGSAPPRSTAAVPAAPTRPIVTADYLPGLAADVVLPDRTGPAPVVVLVPGGGWHTADRSGLLPLARALADGGAVAVPITYRGSDDGGHFPATVDELGCAAAFAVARARAAGIEPRPVVLLGHSAGGNLAALAALSPSHFRTSCPTPAARIDGLIGLAGAYDPAAFGELADPFFNSPRDLAPALWHDGDPLARAAKADHRLRVLLLHGDADDMVPPAMTSRFALALRDGGHDVTVRTVPGADHASIYAAEVAGPPILAWLRSWPS